MQRATKVACNDAACAHANLFRSHRREAWATMQRCEVQECDGAACKCSIQQGNETTTAPAAMQATCNNAACNTQHATMQHATRNMQPSSNTPVPIQSHEGSGWPCTKTGLSGTGLVGNAPKRNRV
jgi:hypothetical protein